MKEVVVVDYGLGNILSVVRAFEHIGCEVKVATSPKDLRGARKIVLPGVGAFPAAVRRLEDSGLKDALLASSHAGIPILGICLGMQLLFSTGYEHAQTPGLGLNEGEVRKISTFAQGDRALRLPEVGWRRVVSQGFSNTSSTQLFSETVDHYFYFVHSYEVKPADLGIITGSYQRSGHLVVASVACNNILGVQYHPEKSGKPGLELLHRLISIPAG